MSTHRRGHTPARRHGKVGKRQVLDPGSSTSNVAISIPTFSQPTSQPPPSLPIPSITSIAHTTVTIIPSAPPTTSGTSTILESTLSITTKSSSSLSLSSSVSPTSAVSTSSAPVAAASLSASESASTTPGPLSSSDVTSLITTMSGAIPITVTTVIKPSASLSPESQPSNSFLDNKAESGVVFAIVAVAAVAGIGSLGYRFYKTMKQRNADRETEEAARAAAKVRVRLDDDDDEDRYGGRASHNAFAQPGMMQLHNEPPTITGGFDPHFGHGIGIGEFDDEPSAENGSHPVEHGSAYPAPSHDPTLQRGPLHLQTAFEGSDIGESAYSAHSMRSGESGDHLLLTRSSTMGGSRTDAGPPSKHGGPSRSNTTTLSTRSNSRSTAASHHLPTRSATQSSDSTSRSLQGLPRPVSGSFTSHTPSSTISRSHSTHLLERPPLPILPLPAAFGEGEMGKAECPPTPAAVGDDEDYHGTMGRVLKIANE